MDVFVDLFGAPYTLILSFTHYETRSQLAPGLSYTRLE